MEKLVLLNEIARIYGVVFDNPDSIGVNLDRIQDFELVHGRLLPKAFRNLLLEIGEIYYIFESRGWVRLSELDEITNWLKEDLSGLYADCATEINLQKVQVFRQDEGNSFFFYHLNDDKDDPRVYRFHYGVTFIQNSLTEFVHGLIKEAIPVTALPHSTMGERDFHNGYKKAMLALGGRLIIN